MQRTILSLVAGVVTSMASFGMAQAPVEVPINNWTYYRHASTFEEGALRGYAATVQAVGQTNYANSLAAVNFAEAYRRQIENSRSYVQTAIENRERIISFRERYSPAPLSREVWEQLSRNGLPDRLTKEQLDNGRIIWPHILRMDQYTALRERIDTLVALRTPDNSGDGSPSQRELHTLIDAMKMLLKENIDTITAGQYGHSKWFLTCLDFEMKHPLDVQGPVAAASSVNVPAAIQTVN